MSKYRIAPAALLLLLSACGYQNLKDVSGQLVSGGPQTLSFATLSQAVFVPKCVGCHGGASAAGGVDLSSYPGLMASAAVVPGAPDSSRIYTAVTAGTMPLGGAPLSKVETDAVYSWIQAGAPEYGTAPAPTPTGAPTSPPTPAPPAQAATFSAVSRTILTARCTSCHTGAGSPRGIDLSSYAQVMATGSVVAGNPGGSPLDSVTASGSMPPSGGALSSADEKLISDWIAGGALNN